MNNCKCSPNDQIDETESQPLTIYFAVSAGIVFFFMAFLIVGYALRYPERTGQFGDSFGVLNAFSSALAFLFVAISLHVQYRDFQHSLKEFRKSSAAQQESAFVQRNATLVQAMELHTTLFKESVFTIKELLADEFARERALRVFDYRWHLESIIADSRSKTGDTLPPRNDYRERRKKACICLSFATQLGAIASSSWTRNIKEFNRLMKMWDMRYQRLLSELDELQKESLFNVRQFKKEIRLLNGEKASLSFEKINRERREMEHGPLCTHGDSCVVWQSKVNTLAQRFLQLACKNLEIKLNDKPT